MQQAQKAAAEAKSERHGIFRLVEKGRVIELQFSERVAQQFIISRVYREKPREHHGLDGFEARQRGGGAIRFDHRVAHARVGHALDIRDHEAHVARGQLVEDYGFGCERSESLYLVNLVVCAKANLHARRHTPLHHANEHDGATVNVEPGIENQRLQRRVRRAFRGRHVLHDGFQHVFHTEAALGADQQRIVGRNGQHIFDLFLRVFRLRGRQVDLVDHRKDREVVPRRQKCVCDSLSLYALARIYYKERALAGGKRARDLIREIDVARRVDQIQAIFVPILRGVVQANALRLDRDAALALEVHRVEHLRLHFALAERAGQLEQSVGQGRFAMVDVGDDAEIADVLGIHELRWRERTRPARISRWF